ncbi:MAG TPA: ABC transporter permease [Candidatus Binataceae bacterium]|nr:ABC transporter permease [Candidatus Binataceae bacterium]
MIWRTTRLILVNEFRLLLHDHAALFMMFLAPVAIIAVAGFSLGNLYGVHPDRGGYLVALLDQDHGVVASTIRGALSHSPGIRVRPVASLAQARQLIINDERAPLALVIPAGTSATFAAGGKPAIELYIDPLKRLQAAAIQAQLAQIGRNLQIAAQARAQHQIDLRSAALRRRLEQLTADARATSIRADAYVRELKAAQKQARRRAQGAIRLQLSAVRTQTQTAIDRSVAQIKNTLASELSARQGAIDALTQYLRALQRSQAQFQSWLDRLKQLAGSHAGQIPPPPIWPAAPNAAQLAILSAPMKVPINAPVLPSVDDSFKLPVPHVKMPSPPPQAPALSDLVPANATLPGTVGWDTRPLISGLQVNSFDQYVPGFGITFLLIDMLWGVGVGLIDEREWGTLQRLRAGGAPVTGLMLGKLSARLLIGTFQMAVLFAVGRLLFGISLGHNPAMLLMPAAAIAFAAGAFGLLIACVARSRDAVLPIGSVAAMAMSAIGGCWWPLGFEPAWMRAVAMWMPTTWTMRAFNDLMIRGLPAPSALVPSAFTFALGLGYLIIGLLGAVRFYD